MKKIGFIGIGKLGLECAEVFAKHYEVRGYDIYPRTSETVKVCDIDELVNEQELNEYRKRHTNVTANRFKGLGEMNPEQLWDTTLNPANRTLLKVEINNSEEAEEYFSMLMGKEVEPRRDFISNNALNVVNIDT